MVIRQNRMEGKQRRNKNKEKYVATLTCKQANKRKRRQWIRK
jgi:hypothetical protein